MKKFFLHCIEGMIDGIAQYFNSSLSLFAIGVLFFFEEGYTLSQINETQTTYFLNINLYLCAFIFFKEIIFFDLKIGFYIWFKLISTFICCAVFDWYGRTVEAPYGAVKVEDLISFIIIIKILQIVIKKVERIFSKQGE